MEEALVAMTYEVSVGERVFMVRVDRLADERYSVTVDGVEHQVQASRLGSDLLLLMDGRSYDAGLVRRDQGWDVDLVGTAHAVKVVDPRRKALRMAGGASEGLLKSAMPGRVVAVLVAVGDTVVKGQAVLVLEAMKMENELKAPGDGVVSRVHVTAGEAVDTGAKLIEIG